MIRKTVTLALLLVIFVFTSYSQNDASDEQQEYEFGFTAAISLGADSIPVGSEMETWNKLGFQPDISFGPIGIGLDLSARFKLYPDPNTPIEFYPGDWIPDYEGSGYSFFDLYMPKIMYVRYGQRTDPFHVKLGSINDMTLGDGFILGRYSNTRFMPEIRFFGLETGLDGRLFDFPYLGFDIIIGNLAKFDVIGGRVYARPLFATGIPVISKIQAGFTTVIDTDPDLYFDNDPLTSAEMIFVWGMDLFLPVIENDLFPMGVFTDFAMQPNNRWGWMMGTAGRLFGIIKYGAQVRVLGNDFITNYFDTNYDLFRLIKYDSLQIAANGKIFAGWAANLGLIILNEIIDFDINLEGPFKPLPTIATENLSDYPRLMGKAVLAKGLLGGFSFEAAYDKYFLGKDRKFFDDLISPENAVITATVSYQTGAAVISLVYNLKYNPESPNGFDIASSIQSTVQF